MAPDPEPSHATGGHVASHRRLTFRAPSPPISVGIIAVEAVLLAALFGLPNGQPVSFFGGLLLVFLLPSLIASVLTGPVASVFGGRLTLRRSLLLSMTAGVTSLPLAIAWRLVEIASPNSLPVAAFLLLLQGPILWFRHMSLFGVSKPSHLASLPPSLVAPLLAIGGIFVLFHPTWLLLFEASLFLIIGFLASALLLQAADRPLQREFGVSGVSLIRPILDHINERDAMATECIEGFFAKFSVPADLRVTLLSFRSGGSTKATIALPTVHPGPFASLGSSNLPHRLAERLGPDAGVVFVPHTPCNHDLDLPTSKEFERVALETQRLFRDLPEGPAVSLASPLVARENGSYARTQILGDTAFVVVTQAPEPTDDIDFAVVDPLVRSTAASGGPRLAIVDAHNSYVEGRGDLSYGTPGAEKLIRDIASSLERARSLAKPGPVRVGVAVHSGYSMREDGVAPEGIRALVVEAAGRKAAYVLIDGNNLVIGQRARLLEALAPLVDDAEVMTTDNHIVHEVDGSTNAVGQRYPVESLARDVADVVRKAVADLTEVRVTSGTRAIPAVPVLQPDWTARLLTSLGDTLSMFSNALLSTFLLVLTGSLVVLLALR